MCEGECWDQTWYRQRKIHMNGLKVNNSISIQSFLVLTHLPCKSHISAVFSIRFMTVAPAAFMTATQSIYRSKNNPQK